MHQSGSRRGVLAWWVNIVHISIVHLQAMEEHNVQQVKIVEALEAEKEKISNELMEMQKRRAVRENQLSRNGQFFWETTQNTSD